MLKETFSAKICFEQKQLNNSAQLSLKKKKDHVNMWEKKEFGATVLILPKRNVMTEKVVASSKMRRKYVLVK